MKKVNRHQERVIVVTTLYQYLLLHTDIDQLLENNLDDIDKDNVAFIVSRVIKTIENMDSYIEQIKNNITTNWDWERLGYIEQAILLYGVFELEEKEIDKAVIIDECVNIAKTYCEDNAPSLINGVLDRIC